MGRRQRGGGREQAAGHELRHPLRAEGRTARSRRPPRARTRAVKSKTPQTRDGAAPTRQRIVADRRAHALLIEAEASKKKSRAKKRGASPTGPRREGHRTP